MIKTIDTSQITEEMFKAFRLGHDLSGKIFNLLEAAPEVKAEPVITCQTYGHKVRLDGCGECNLPLEFVRIADVVERIRALPVGFAGSGTYVRLEDVLEIIEGAKLKAPKLPERLG
jgi:hypothetical protein